jgi:hypothetical protein
MLGWVGFLAAEKGIAQPPLWDVGHANLPVMRGVFLLLFKVGWWITVALMVRGILVEPERIPNILFICSFWGSIRILCIYVTILGAPEGLPPPPPLTDVKSFWEEIVYGLSSRNILFFSGHTGFPILGAMIFYKSEIFVKLFGIRVSLTTLFWSWSAIMGFTVIVTREHYTIDVVAALFMTLGIWLSAEWFIWPKLFKWVDRATELIKRDYKKFSETEEK